jgi:TetR/AcrR family transcriptional regulator, transcriptional repressor for nem operon
MSRPIEFSRDDARGAIADVFAAHGYEGTTLAMLTKASGLGKQSLYNAFGDKEQMYFDAIDCSVSRFGEIVTKMNAAPSGWAALEVCFGFLVDCCMSDKPSTSNCIVSTGLLSNSESDTLHCVHCARWEQSHALLLSVIARGHKDGSVNPDLSAAAGADILMSHMSGFRVSAQVYRAQGSARAARARLQQLQDVALSIFKIPATRT